MMQFNIFQRQIYMFYQSDKLELSCLMIWMKKTMKRTHLIIKILQLKLFIKELYQNLIERVIIKSFLSERRYIIFMKEQQTSEFYGVDVSDWSIVPLRSQELNDQLKSRYLPVRGHLFSEALQHGSTVPSLKNMVRTVKRNDNKLSQGVRLKGVVNSWKPDDTVVNLASRLQNQRQGRRRPQNNTKLAVPILKTKPYTIMSPEAIVVKCAKRAFERTLYQNKDDILVQGRIKKQASPYFDRKKKNQIKRRMERLILIKAFKWQLLEIFGKIIFTSRWMIGREQLINALNLVPSQINYEYLVNFIRERKNYRTVRDRVSDYRLVRFIYNNPFRTLQRKNIVEYSLKLENQKKYDRRKKDGRQLKTKKSSILRKQKLFTSLKQKTNKKALNQLASSTLTEQILIKEEELEESETETVQTDSAEPLNTISSS